MGRSRRPQPKRLAAKLAEIRSRLDLTQTQIVKRLSPAGSKLQPGHISEFENGMREPSLLVLLRYARIAGIYVDALIDDDIDLPERLPAEAQQEWVMVPRDSLITPK